MGFSETLSFVKKYPITLCGVSLLFMPSVHQLLLYFTPLLLSTGIFVVAMLTSANPSSNNNNNSTHSKEEEEEEHDASDPRRHGFETFGFVGDADADAGHSHGWGAHLEREPQFLVPTSTTHLRKPSFSRLAHKCADPDLCEKHLERSEPDPDLCEKHLASSEPNPDLCEKHLASSEPDPDLCEKPLASSEPDRDLCEKLLTRSEPDPDLCEKHLASSEPDPDLCEKPLERSEPDPDLCEKPLARSEPELYVEPILVDPDLCEKSLAGVEPELYAEPILVDEEEAALVNERHVEVDIVEKALGQSGEGEEAQARPHDVHMLLATSRRLPTEHHHDSPSSLCLVNNNTFSQPSRTTLQVAL